MVVAEDIRGVILKMAARLGPEKTFCVSDIAREMDKENWPALIDQVSLVASVMITEGKLSAPPTDVATDTFMAKA